jgi:hypothetical protein
MGKSKKRGNIRRRRKRKRMLKRKKGRREKERKGTNADEAGNLDVPAVDASIPCSSSSFLRFTPNASLKEIVYRCRCVSVKMQGVYGRV